jgi:hypothetical protein
MLDRGTGIVVRHAAVDQQTVAQAAARFHDTGCGGEGDREDALTSAPSEAKARFLSRNPHDCGSV